MATWKVRIQTLSSRRGARGPRRIVEDRGSTAILQPSGPVYNPVYFDLHPLEGMFRGGHYHRNQTETFYIIRGSCKIRYVDLETGDTGTVEAGEGDLVTISPGCAHQLEATEFLRAIEYSKQEVSYQDDTFRYDFS